VEAIPGGSIQCGQDSLSAVAQLAFAASLGLSVSVQSKQPGDFDYFSCFGPSATNELKKIANFRVAD
jgi:hypothetical protein